MEAKRRKLIFLIGIVFLCSCDTILCGKLPVELENMVNDANQLFDDKVEVNPIPCEFSYINIRFTETNIDTAVIRDLHKVLYDKDSRTGWNVLLVHNVNNNYIFSHSSRGLIYIQDGD